MKKTLRDALHNAVPDTLRVPEEKNPFAAPDSVIWIVLAVQAFVFVCAFVGLTVWSLLYTFTVTTTVSDVVKPTPYTCNVLSPRDSLVPFDATISEGAHYSTATETTASCIANLQKNSKNCDPYKMAFGVLSIFGYSTSTSMCYAFFRDGTALCTDAAVQPLTFNTLHGGIPFRPPLPTQRSFPNFASFPAQPPGTYFRQFAQSGAPLVDAGFDFTLSISTSYLQSAGFAPVADSAGQNIYYVSSSVEPSSNVLVWQFHRIAASNPQAKPEVVQAFGGVPPINAACGMMATATYFYFGVALDINGQVMNFIYQGNVAKRPVVWSDAISLQDIFTNINPQPRATDFLCRTTTRAMTIGDDGFGYMLMNPTTITYPNGVVDGAARLIRFDPNLPLQPQLVALTSANYWDPFYISITSYNSFGFSTIAKIGSRLYVSGANVVIYWNLPALPNPFTDANPAVGVQLTAIPAYASGFYTVFGNTQQWSMLLTPGYKANTLWVMFSGHAYQYDLSKVDFASVEKGNQVPLPNDPYNDQTTAPYIYKNVSMGWGFGLCNGKLYNVTDTNLPGFLGPPFYSALCNVGNGYFIQSSFATTAVFGCSKYAPSDLANCPLLVADVSKNVNSKCQMLISQTCNASFNRNPPFLCSINVPPSVVSAIGSSVASANIVFGVFSTVLALFVTKVLYRKKKNTVEVERRDDSSYLVGIPGDEMMRNETKEAERRAAAAAVAMPEGNAPGIRPVSISTRNKLLNNELVF